MTGLQHSHEVFNSLFVIKMFWEIQYERMGDGAWPFKACRSSKVAFSSLWNSDKALRDIGLVPFKKKKSLIHQ